jgi:hypothetical protein
MSLANDIPDPQRLQELRHLISRLCESELQPDELARLEALLLEDEACCEYYVTALQFTAVLPRYAGGVPFRSSMSNEGSSPVCEPCGGTAASTDGETADSLSVVKPQRSILPLPLNLSSRGLSPANILWLAVMLVGVSIFTSWGLWQDKPVPVATPAPGTPLMGVNVVRLDTGTAQLMIPQVGHVILEGPAEFELTSAKRARLVKGRMKLRVTEKTGQGFVVDTPHGEVTDLGTEFGLDLTNRDEAGLVVFEGSVDLRVARSNPLEVAPAERLVGGEAVVFKEGQSLKRMMAITSGGGAIFAPAAAGSGSRSREPLIVDVSDNLGASETKKFYEIVPGGLQEDALAYVDRPKHQWNGFTKIGIPSYLLGADYIKTFSNDKTCENFEMHVTVSKPVKLFVFFDDRVSTPAWVQENFRYTGEGIGLDSGVFHRPENGHTYRFRTGTGPGDSIDARLSIWERVVDRPGKVTLGSNGGKSDYSTMYGVAAIPLEGK